MSLGSRRVAAGSGTWGQLCQCSGSSDKLLTFGSDKSWERTCTVLLRKARHPQALLTFEILVWFQEPLLNFTLLLLLFIAKHWVWSKQTKTTASLSLPPSVQSLHPQNPQYSSSTCYFKLPLVCKEIPDLPHPNYPKKNLLTFFLFWRVLQVHTKPQFISQHKTQEKKQLTRRLLSWFCRILILFSEEIIPAQINKATFISN